MTDAGRDSESRDALIPESPGMAPSQLEGVYERRFNRSDSDRKDGVWAAIAEYLQRYIPKDARVLDIACDRGSFIRHVVAGERWASDIRDMKRWLPDDVHFVQSSGLALDKALPTHYFDVVFMSNYLEHLLSRSEVVRQLEVAHALLRSGGRLLVLQPNVRLVGGSYWDFIDHHVALTERSLKEAATLAGFRTEQVVVRFLPYSTLGRLPQHRLLVTLYLRVPVVWWLLGKQTLYVGTT
ncbi:MAG: methyltransferase domain-containing protein [Candidatus Dormiibacterota bacterium]